MKQYFSCCILKLSTFITIAILVIITAAYASNVHFTKSSVVTAAEGKVKIKKDKNNNYAIHISIIRLAEAERLQPHKKTYVAWIDTNGYGTKNIGRLVMSTSCFYYNGGAWGSMQYPAGQVVLTT